VTGRTAEKENYLAAHNIKAVSGKSNTYEFCQGVKGDIEGNKSIYVSMITYEGICGKKTFGGKSLSAKTLSGSNKCDTKPRWT